jgi:hypothetical protein
MRLISMLSTEKLEPKVKHYLGLPPDLTMGSDKRQELDMPSFVVIEENSDGVFLYRYDTHGACVGDTWHTNVEDAKHQASYEYGNSLREWSEVPPAINDAVDFGLTKTDHNS